MNVEEWQKHSGLEGKELQEFEPELLLVSHNILHDVPEELCSAELLGLIESVHTVSFAKMDL